MPRWGGVSGPGQMVRASSCRLASAPNWGVDGCVSDLRWGQSGLLEGRRVGSALPEALRSPYPPRHGASVAGGADVNADGWPDAAQHDRAAVASSTNQRARMQWPNTLSVTANDLRLSADPCPPNKPGPFFHGPSATELLDGDGHLCVAGGSFRLGVVNTRPTGTPTWPFDVLQPPSPTGQVQPGDTWHFSFWIRDPTGGPAGFNVADGLRATFCT